MLLVTIITGVTLSIKNSTTNGVTFIGGVINITSNNIIARNNSRPIVGVNTILGAATG